MNESKTLQLHDDAEGIEVALIVSRLEGGKISDDVGYSGGSVVYTLIGPGVEKSSHDLFKLANETMLTNSMKSFLFDRSFESLEHDHTYEV